MKLRYYNINSLISQDWLCIFWNLRSNKLEKNINKLIFHQKIRENCLGYQVVVQRVGQQTSMEQVLTSWKLPCLYHSFKKLS